MILKASYKNILINALIIGLFSLGVLLIKNQEVRKLFIIVAVIISIYYILLFFDKRPTSIKIEDPNLVITFNQFLVCNTQVSENISELTQSFKEEVGPKGTLRNVYRILKGNRTILKIVPNYNGWSTAKIQTLSDNLQKLGVTLIN